MAKSPNKELYAQLRRLTCEQLWQDEVPRFDQSSMADRIDRVGLVRAVGVVFSESGTETQKAQARDWLVQLLQDPAEKIRRYAMTALPKLGSGKEEEAALLELLHKQPTERERKFLGQSLDKIGGTETLQSIAELGPQTEQKVKASVARGQKPTSVDMDAILETQVEVRLHCRKGLEEVVREELATNPRTRETFRLQNVREGLVSMTSQAPFSLGDLYSLRCFGHAGIVLGKTSRTAAAITSPLSQKILSTFTDGPIRYRLDFLGKGHQRGAIRTLANEVYSLCPKMLNDARNAPWAIELSSDGTVEIRPRLVPDPRFIYRREDVPAASHPPLAASLARLAGRQENENIWDPFCGSGLELIECALLGGVQKIYGTDLSKEAIAITQKNFTAAGVDVPHEFVCCDFRETNWGNLSLVITNPPLGRRVPIASIRQLITDLFYTAAKSLRLGGRLVLINPLPETKSVHPALQLQSRRTVDLGGFTCRMELYFRK